MFNPQSKIRNPQSAIRNPQSAIKNLSQGTNPRQDQFVVHQFTHATHALHKWHKKIFSTFQMIYK